MTKPWIRRYCVWALRVAPQYFKEYETLVQLREAVREEIGKNLRTFIEDCEKRNQPRMYLIPPRKPLS